MDRNRVISIILLVLMVVFIGLAVNEFYQYRKSDETYEEAREVYYSENDVSVEEEDLAETPDVVEDSNTHTGPGIPADTTTDSEVEATTESVMVAEENNENDDPSDILVETAVPDNGASQEEKAAVAEAGSVIGWVSIPGTGIDYPVVQTTDNEYYLTHNYLGNKDVKGAIYMDFRNDDIGDDRNYILYGHKMIDGSMFSDLVYYVQDGSYKRYFYNYNTVKYDDYEEETEWKIFSAYVVDLSKEEYYLFTNYKDDEKYQAFIDRAYKKSILDSDIEVTLEDEIMTLVTCSFWYKNSRVILHAVRQ